MRGVPVWATLISLMVEDEVVVGVVSAPQLNRRWWAMKDGGAFTGRSLLKPIPIRVSDVSRLEDASFSYSSLDGWDHAGRLDDFLTLSRHCWRTRAYGDFWSHMLVAEGAVDFAAEPELELYDMAALDVIVREAGGRFTSLDGRDGPHGRQRPGQQRDAARDRAGVPRLGRPRRAPRTGRPRRRPTGTAEGDGDARRRPEPGAPAPRETPRPPRRRDAAPAQRPPSRGADGTGSGPAPDVTGSATRSPRAVTRQAASTSRRQQQPGQVEPAVAAGRTGRAGCRC